MSLTAVNYIILIASDLTMECVEATHSDDAELSSFRHNLLFVWTNA